MRLASKIKVVVLLGLSGLSGMPGWGQSVPQQIPPASSGGSMTWPSSPGLTVCTGTPCTAWGSSIVPGTVATLQPSLPGTPQTGNINLSGGATFGGLVSVGNTLLAGKYTVGTPGTGQTALPAASSYPSAMALAVDCESTSACAVGGGTTASWLRSDGSAWSLAGGGSGTGAPVFSTSGPVTVAAASNLYINNASGPLTYNLPAITSAMVASSITICFRNNTSGSGSITLHAPASTYIDLNGTNSAGARYSSGLLGDSACVLAVSTTEYFLYPGSGLWN